jgi:phosphate transport system substrate-binding protein
MTLLVLTFPANAGQTQGSVLVFAGSGTNLPIVRVLAKEFKKRHPGVRIDVPASIGSSSGIKAAADGAIALGLTSRPLKESEKKQELEVIAFARTPIIIGVNQSVAEKNISYAEIIDIYRGKKTRWQNGREIIVLTREPGDSSIEAMNSVVPNFREVYEESQKSRRWITLIKDLKMNETLARTTDAIGFSDLGAIKIEGHRIKPLAVNGVSPAVNTLESGAYPLFKPLLFVFHKERLPPAAGEFIAFVRSKEGAKIMRANGYLPEK